MIMLWRHDCLGGAQSLGSTQAVLFSELNPENAQSDYFFEYAQAGSTLAACTRVSASKQGTDCAGVSRTPILSSGVYGKSGGSAEVSGLRPGTTYAYRISVSSGYILNESHTLQGAPVVFTTAGAATVLAAPSSLPILATPVVPSESTKSLPATKCKQGKVRNKHGVCVKKKAKKKVRKARKARRSGAHKVG